MGPGRTGERVAQFGESAAFDRDHFDDGDAERCGQCRRVDRDAALVGLIDHVQREHHRFAERCELAREHQGAAHVARVGHLDDQVGLGAGDEPAHLGELLLRPPLGHRHGGAGVVGNRDVTAREPPEHDALADVGLTDERDAQRARTQGQYWWPAGGAFVNDVTGHARGSPVVGQARCRREQVAFLAVSEETPEIPHAAAGNFQSGWGIVPYQRYVTRAFTVLAVYGR